MTTQKAANRSHYFFYLFAHIFLFICLFSVLFLNLLSYEKLTSYINTLRPGKPYTFFTPNYHFYFKTYSILIGFFFLGLIIFLKNRKYQYLDYIHNLKIEFYTLVNKTRTKINIFFTSEKKTHLYVIFSIFFIGIGVRLFYLNRPMFHDESKTFYSFISRGWIETITNYYVPNNHVFHSVLSRFSFLIFGNEEWAIRLPVFFVGCITILFCYFSTRSIFNKNIAIILTAITTNAIPLVNYSVNARGFIINTFFFLLLLLITKELNKTHNVILFSLSIIISALGLWAVPSMIMPLLFIFYWYLLSSNLKNLLGRFLKSMKAISLIGFLSLFFYSPIILRATNIKILVPNHLPAVKSMTIDIMLYHLFNFWNFLTSGYSQNFKYIIIVFLFIGVIYHLSHKRGKKLFYTLILTSFSFVFIFKIIPTDRSLLWFYPIFWTYVVTGIYSILILISKIIKIKIEHLSNYFSLLIFSYTLIICIEEKATIQNYKQQTFIEAEKIIEDIQGELTKNQKIMTSSPLAGPIRYYLMKNNIPKDVLFWSVDKSKSQIPLLNSDRIYIITRNGRNNLESYGFELSRLIREFSPPKLWKVYLNNAKVYTIDKL
mgnify:FL=1|jgi:hypothetical protein